MCYCSAVLTNFYDTVTAIGAYDKRADCHKLYQKPTSDLQCTDGMHDIQFNLSHCIVNAAENMTSNGLS